MGSQDSVTSRIVYGNTISFSEIMGYLYDVTGQMATHFRFLISWAVNTLSPGHMATHSSSPISWSVKTPLLVVLCTPYNLYFPSTWVVNAPSLGYMATYSPTP
ncbi:hypothetical protein Bpfe_014442 [Biomphalaria pfeifferi]|uniref:Uncharacterized protein n=1 Tax=Biomphalaria pfeifferi TaxID=112525 RepID=A0AAD8BKM5_BIOPF|nr:hypothetical protein Bpfe_014442 [Biomphalaria pfeifferi]